jgi:hypothetical protein
LVKAKATALEVVAATKAEPGTALMAAAAATALMAGNDISEGFVIV